MYFVLIFATLLSIAVCAPVNTKSPCQEKFEYRSSDVPGKWTGNVNISTDYKLYGTWLRLIFDGPVKNVEVEGDSGLKMAKYDDEVKNEVLLKNRDFVIKKNTPIKVPITVSFEGEKSPNLIGYRLNGRDVCPGLE